MNNQLKTILLVGALSALVVGIGAAVAPSYVVLFGVLALAMNVGAYFWSDRLVLRMSGAREVTWREAPRLHELVADLSARAGIPKPRVAIIPSPQPNAFATGRNPKHGVVAVTEGILAILTERELRGVLAHELAHIKNRDILVSTIAAVMAGVVTSIANALSFAALFGSSDDEDGGGNLLLALVAPIAATVVQLGISRSREYLADEAGARISGDPEALASALLKLEQAAHVLPSGAQPATASLYIVNPLRRAGSLLQLFSTHPSIDERVRRLRAMAAESRPSFTPPFGWWFGRAAD